MNLGAIFIGLSMLIIAIPFIVIPFQQGRKKRTILTEKPIDPEERRLAVLSSLRDLDFDHQTGKVNETDYSSLRGRLVTEAAQSLQQDDKVDEIETLIQARKALNAKGVACPNCGQPLESNIRFCPKCGTRKTPTCPSCGKNIKANDLFCTSCGNKLVRQIEVGS